MKTLILGDIHGMGIWKHIIELEDGLDHIIFMGDYFDSFDIPGIDQLHNFNEIIRFKEETDIKVTMLIGNHDHHYLIPN
jgi:DNA repair exonuclease SbcCD nuclease subunit